MPKSYRPYPPEFLQCIIELVRLGHARAELAPQFEPSAQATRTGSGRPKGGVGGRLGAGQSRLTFLLRCRYRTGWF